MAVAFECIVYPIYIKALLFLGVTSITNSNICILGLAGASGVKGDVGNPGASGLKGDTGDPGPTGE